ncbi:hypothetical protein IPM62_02530 [Candidatus Woesebacteria bacterium]|nr:MAG: hypothetical protein IPM62_02530 [Candidatus Woesebacteria bacterium]
MDNIHDKKEILVIKRDNSEEVLETQKFTRIAKATGLSDEEASRIADIIRDRVLVIALKNAHKIKSTEIRDIFIDELSKTNQYAANLYKWYETTK